MAWKNFLLRTRLAYEEAKAITQRTLNANFPTARPEVAQLEDRVLLSASPVPVIVDGESASANGGSTESAEPSSTMSDEPVADTAMGEQSATPDASSDVRNTEDTLGLLDLLDEYVSSETTDEQPAQFASGSDVDAAEFFRARHELVLIDNRLPEFEQLIEELQAHSDASREFQIVVISGTDNGLDVLGNALAELQHELDAVHIFSHGTNGLILLGSTTLSQDTLSLHTELFASWQTAVSEDADLLLYGCKVATAETGQTFVNQLALLTGMDIAASIDATGHSALGGDWDLEYATGQIETPLALSGSFQDRWLGLLPTYEQFTSFTQDAELSSDANWGQTFSHNSGLGQYAVNQVSLVMYRASDASAQGITVTLRTAWDATIVATATIASDELSTTHAWVDFDFNTVYLFDEISYTIQVTGTSPDGGAFLGYAPDGYTNGTLIGPDGSTLFDSDMAFRIDYVNSAPVLNASKSPFLAAQSAVSGAPFGNVGTLISSLVDLNVPQGQIDNVSDIDPNTTVGIAITAANATNGEWWYTTNGGSSWLALGSVTDNNARLLAADANTRLYFQPNPNYNGTIADAITFRAWDQTSGTNGTLADTTVNGGTTAFSIASDTASILVNDAPLLDTSGTLTLATITEDETSNAGHTVAEILISGGTNPITDVNTGAVEGIAITSLSSGNGTWQYSLNGGSSWLSVGTVSTSSALLLRDTDRIRFLPDAMNGTNASFTFCAWDQATGSVGTKVSVVSNGGTTAFSTATESASILVTSVNDAPVVNTSRSPALVGIYENSPAPVGALGTLVSALADFASPTGQVDNITDVDTGALLGIAVTATNSMNGTWYYSTDGGANWYAMGSVSTNSARLLAADANTRLYFQPNPNYNGTIADAITFRAWDQTSGTNGTLADTTVNGGTTAFSIASDTASILVNDAPLLDTSGTLTLATITEDETSNAGHTVAEILTSGGTNPITDVNTGAVEGIAITSLSSGNGTWQYSLNGGSSWLSVGTVSTSSALLLRDTDRIRFLPNAMNGTNASFTFCAWDQATGSVGTKVSVVSNGGTTAFSTATESASILVTSVNDAPVVNTSRSPTLVDIDEDSSTPVGAVGTLVSALVDFSSPVGQVDNITDVDTGALLGIAVTATNSTNGNWYYSTDGGANWYAVGSVSTNSARLLAADANTRLYFQPNPNYNGTIADAITFRAWDQTSGMNGTLADTTVNGGITAFSATTDTASLVVNSVNDPPVITSNGSGATATLNVLENTTAVTIVTATDIDLPAQTLSYSIVGGVDAACFVINSNTGVLTFVSGRDREDPTDADSNHVYEVTVSVSDGTDSDTQDLSITVTDVDEFDTGLVTDANANANTVAENAGIGTAVGVTAAASDADATNNVITYSLDDNAGGLFAIHATTGVVTVNGALDYEVATSHSVTVRATSSDGSYSTQSFTLNVSNVNETPVSAVDQYFLDRGQTLTVGNSGVLGNDSDIDGDALTAVLQSGVAHGLLVFRADGTFTYQPNPTFFGIDQFTYLATDGALATETVTVTLVVNNSLPQPDTGNNWDKDNESDDSSTEDSSSNAEQEQDVGERIMEGDARITDTPDAGPDAATFAELTTDVQEIIQRAFGGRTLEQELEAALTDSEHDRDRSATQAKSLAALPHTRALLNSGMIATLRSEGLAYEASHDSLVLSTLPLSLESTSMPEEHVNQAPGISPESLVLGTSAVVSSALTVGYVTWLLRGGSLLASLLASLPAWASFDPLPVLMSGTKPDEEDEDKDRLVDLVRGEETGRSVNSAAPTAGLG